jgi:hypothetical protein
MNDNSATKPGGLSTFWFAALTLWLFLFAHVADDVRHRHENLFLFFIVPFLIGATAASVWGGRLFWHQFPRLAPRGSQPPAASTHKPVAIALLVSLGAAALWGNSALFVWCYDSCKIIVLMVLAGTTFGFIYKVGGRGSVLVSLLSGLISAAGTLATFGILSLLAGGGRDLPAATLFLASIGVPYSVAVALYDCYRRALAQPTPGE